MDNQVKVKNNKSGAKIILGSGIAAVSLLISFSLFLAIMLLLIGNFDGVFGIPYWRSHGVYIAMGFQLAAIALSVPACILTDKSQRMPLSVTALFVSIGVFFLTVYVLSIVRLC